VSVGVIGYWSILNAAQAPAGTSITNQASAEYTSGTATYTVQSNTVETIVQPVGALTLDTSQSKTITENGGTLDFPHVITNTGNVTDKYIVSANTATGTIFDTVVMYNDANCDGTVDSPLVQFTGLSPSIPINNQFCFVVRAVVKPGTHGTTPDGTIEVKANGSSYPVTDPTELAKLTNTDSVDYTSNGSLIVVKSMDISSGGPGTEVTYTLAYTNNGGYDVTKILLYDKIPPNMRYVVNSGKINGVETLDADDSWTYAGTPGTETIAVAIAGPLVSTTGSNTGYISFKVTVATGATGTIDNTPFFCYNDSVAVVPSTCDAPAPDGTPDLDDIPDHHETGNKVTFTVLLDFLKKFQALDSDCDGTINVGTSYTQSQLTAGAVPGACIRYKIVASNNTGTTVTGVKVFDQTPTYTVFDDGSRNAAGAIAQRLLMLMLQPM
jgi:uncharacterized repeat protein (TIGR01451 family)